MNMELVRRLSRDLQTSPQTVHMHKICMEHKLEPRQPLRLRTKKAHTKLPRVSGQVVPARYYLPLSI